MLSSSPFHFRFRSHSHSHSHFPFPYPSPPSPVIANPSSLPRVPPYGGGGGCRPPQPPLLSYIPSLGALVPFPKKKPCCVLPADAAASIESRQGAWRGEHEEDEEDALPSGLRREWLPRHVAVIMDGNSRWAKARSLPTSAGHEAGYKALREMLRLSCAWGIRVLTVFAFSSENWLRPKAEVDFLMMLFERILRENIGNFLRESIRVRIIGDSSKLPFALQKLAKEVEEMSRNNSRIELVVAVSYSGRGDIAQACQKISQKVKHGLLEPEEITESLIAQELETRSIEFPCPDLLIRTSGEARLSNFLLWQSAYSELFFTKTYWPDFGETDYVEALFSFQKRQRRFGQRIT